MHEDAQPLRVEVGWDGVIATIALTEELNATSAPGMTERLMKVAQAHAPGALVLDLRGLTFIYVVGGTALDWARMAIHSECPVIVRWPPAFRPPGHPSGRLPGRLAAPVP